MFRPVKSRLIFVLWIAVTVQGTTLAQGVRINEVMTSNRSALLDEQGDSSDWIELFNSSSEPINLVGYGLSDEASFPFKWQFGQALIPPGGFLLVFASGKDRHSEPALAKNPSELTGLRLWLDAARIATNDPVQVRRSGTVVFVRRWNDVSGALNHGSQSVDANQPLWIESAINGHSAVRFDGANDLLRLLRPVGTNSFCIFAVLRTSLSHEIDPESSGGVGGVSGQRYLFGATHGGDFNAGAGVSIGTNGISVYEHGSSYMPALAVSQARVSSGAAVLSVNYAAKRPEIGLGGVVVRTGLTSSRADVTAPVEIGSGAYGAFRGDIAEIITFNRALDDSERAGVTTYLMEKYGLELALPPQHTSFQLSARGEELVLTKADSITADRVSLGAIPQDVSYGRQPDATGPFLFFSTATPGTSNNTPGASEFLSAPVFSENPGFHSNNLTLAISAAESDVQIRYTLDGSEPAETSSLYTGPLILTNRSPAPNVLSNIPTTPGGPVASGTVAKGWVVRARSFKSGALPSAVATRTFWIDPRGRGRYTLPVISLATDRRNFFDASYGIYVPGNAPNGNYSQRGPDWERPVHVEFLETNNLIAFSQEGDVKIHGNTSQGFPIKGLDLDGTGGNGRQPFRYRIFPDRERTEFEHFLLRPTGHDQQTAFMRDELMQSIGAETGAESQAARACVVFINGEYWGLHYLKEKEDVDFVSFYSGVPATELDYLEGYAAAKAGDTVHYNSLIQYLTANDPRQQTVFAEIQNRIDIGNYIDYKACEIFFYRWDIGNHRLWRSHSPEGRWRWLQFDNDVGWGGFWAIQPAWDFNMLAADLSTSGSLNGHNNETTTFLLRRLILNASFKRDFINRFADLLNTAFRSDRTVPRINQMAARLQPEMAEHTRRWRSPSSLTAWQSNVQYLKNYATNRAQFVRQHIVQQFALGGTAQVSIAVGNTNAGSLRLNTITIESGTNAPWSGIYFKGNPVAITAVPKPGYQFSRWKETAQTNNPLTLLLDRDVSLTAEFNRDSSAAPQFTLITRLSQGSVRLEIKALPESRCQLQSSTDLVTWSDSQLVSVNAAGTATIQLAPDIRSFFRLLSVP
jgi:hypothetical protein